MFNIIQKIALIKYINKSEPGLEPWDTPDVVLIVYNLTKKWEFICLNFLFCVLLLNRFEWPIALYYLKWVVKFSRLSQI